MSLKIEFVERAAKGEKVTVLCREFGVSRQAGHKWIKRFKELGYDGLEEQSRRPKTAPLATAEELVMAVLEARDAHPRWRPRKLEPLLRRRFGDQTPSARTRCGNVAGGVHRTSSSVRRRSRRKRRTTCGRSTSRAGGDRSMANGVSRVRSGNSAASIPETLRPPDCS